MQKLARVLGQQSRPGRVREYLRDLCKGVLGNGTEKLIGLVLIEVFLHTPPRTSTPFRGVMQKPPNRAILSSQDGIISILVLSKYVPHNLRKQYILH
jgi:hypothetical protein